jgi:hypothetical protein
LRIERVDQRRSGQFVHVEVLPGVFTVVAAWMLDASACAGMDLGVPHVSRAALSDLDDLLMRRGLRRSSSGDITAGEEQTDARPDRRPSSPKQMRMQFDSTRLRGMSPQDRQQAVTRLAILLTEAAGAAATEQHDDGR